jgi:hypothetical protein
MHIANVLEEEGERADGMIQTSHQANRWKEE